MSNQRATTTNETTEEDQAQSRRPFRAADVLTGRIDKRRPGATRTRKQVSAQLDAHQVRVLGELHARLNATATERIEKSDLVGLGIELLAAVLADVDGEPGTLMVAAPDGASRGRGKRKRAGEALRDVDDIRSYLRTHVRAYAESGR
ncbi:MAG: hypothetical protein ACJ789_00060 [Thermomicrobiales bacterium]